MTPAKTKKVRALLKTQHSQLIAVKTKYIRQAVAKAKPLQAVLSSKIDSWTRDGKFKLENGKDAKQLAAKTATALSVVMRNALADSSADAAKLAVDHLHMLSDFAQENFDGEPLDIDESAADYDDDDRLDELQLKYIGNTKFGAYATLMKLGAAVLSGAVVDEFARSVKADSADPDDIAVALFSRLDARTESYIRTETGRAYGAAMSDAAESIEQKRWATIDPGCEEICHPTDGQIVDMDDTFELGNEDEVDYPPAHPNCDCTWFPWVKEWGNTQSTDDIASPLAA